MSSSSSSIQNNNDNSTISNFETECGWKGKMMIRKDTIGESTRTAAISTCSSSSSSSTTADADYNEVVQWLGGEPNLKPINEELQGVRTILASLTDAEKEQMMKFDTTMIIRHFRAEKGNTTKAINQIKETLQWRKDFDVDIIVNCFTVEGTDNDTDKHKEMRSIFKEENIPGKIYVRGYDADGRALMYMTPARENTNNMINNMRHLVFNLEKAIACTRRKSQEIRGTNKFQPLEKVNLLIDYDGFQLKNAPPMATTRYTLDILQKHYPERMYHAYLLHPPRVFQFFWALIKTFVDPITKEKIVFCSGKNGKGKLTDNVTDKHKLEERSYGTVPVREFDSNEYLHLPYDVSFDE